ncbi:hypothetical protein NV379_02335 [Paenibacillus sp. N1-5-1-14]|uniref:hypothetical protein n=1 Tax=Paenibacillus radicibacter TaxID=2972488 RepID=UPI002158D03D|nr:hypothetical protein [Paenibacillus radicibacter]MCR8641485.1 hypothetical protein [Paenibacillus radicibacter]
MNGQKYRLEKLKHYDPKSKIETWISTNLKSDEIYTLEIFLVEGYRIFDCELNKEVKRILILNQ